MKNILFIVNAGKISPNENGGAAVYFSHLELLHRLGYQIHLLALEWNKELKFQQDDYTQIEHFITSLDSYQIIHESVNKLNHLYNAIFKPEKFEYLFLNPKNKSFLIDLLEKKNIELVWAEWRWAGLLTWYTSPNVPTIYAHHDWQFKLARLRKKRGLLEQFHIYQKKRAEYRLVRGVEACVSGSNTEVKEIEQIAHKNALYLPTTYEFVASELQKQRKPNIVHLGGMGTTANRIGLERFLEICWPKIKKGHSDVNLWVIGSLKEIPASLQEKLDSDAQIVCKGFVKDLSAILYPNDIHIIPWEFNTGTRTRVPLIFNFRQVLVATKASVEAFPEIIHDQNALLCDSLEKMTVELNLLLNDNEKIERLSTLGKDFFETNFTVASKVPVLKKFLDKII